MSGSSLPYYIYHKWLYRFCKLLFLCSCDTRILHNCKKWHSVDLQKHLVNTRESSFAVIEYWKYELIKKIASPSPLSPRGNKEILIYKNKDNVHFCLITIKCVICRLIEKTSKKKISFSFPFCPPLVPGKT